MTEAEVLAALAEARAGADARPEGCLTTGELMEQWGMSRQSVLERLRPLVKAGAVEARIITVENIVGRRQRVPAYRLRDAAA